MKHNSKTPVTKKSKPDIIAQKKQELKECLIRLKEMNQSANLKACHS